MAKPQSPSSKQSLYFPSQQLDEIKMEAERLDRSISWVVQRAWKLALIELRKLPSSTLPPPSM